MRRLRPRQFSLTPSALSSKKVGTKYRHETSASTMPAATAVSGPAKRYDTPIAAPAVSVRKKNSPSESTIGQLRHVTGTGVTGRAATCTGCDPLDFDAVGGASVGG